MGVLLTHPAQGTAGPAGCRASSRPFRWFGGSFVDVCRRKSACRGGFRSRPNRTERSSRPARRFPTVETQRSVESQSNAAASPCCRRVVARRKCKGGRPIFARKPHALASTSPTGCERAAGSGRRSAASNRPPSRPTAWDRVSQFEEVEAFSWNASCLQRRWPNKMLRRLFPT